ncbi:class I SAM-dependent methyltransferase [Novosphingobium sp. TH158]|uniref:class I SAM-dependent methyltransferase n=1 Tax=Novosphingobium sp. TH158 TaxID=2067455 RepID=UPI001181BF57|nr:class I SAM-dependent methyltransferase [Novosphingobium sp. TH158]
MTDISHLLASYPRERAPLPEEYQRVYAEQYKINREGTTAVDGAAQKLEQWMHRKVASVSGDPVLELGAGTLNHLRFEPNAATYDIVEPFVSLFEGKPELSRVRASYASVHDVPPANRYARVISIAVLEHLTDLPRDLARSALLLDEGGVFQAGIPSEGGLLWWLGWRFSTGLAYFLRTGLDYGKVMRHEHVNSAQEILKVVSHLFADVRTARFPLPSGHLSFYTYLEAREPRLDLARRILAESAGEGA